MNAQRWLALVVVGLFIAVVATTPLWVSQLKRGDKDSTATPSGSAAAALLQDEADSNAAFTPTSSSFPTQDPVITSLMSELGITELGVGDEPYIIMAGDFSVIDDLRMASGTASIYQIGDVTHALRLEPFEITAGPDLHVLLSLDASPRTSSDTLLPTHVDLGPLKFTEGAQNYDIPDQVMISRYKSVVIYSLSLNLVYSTASLTQVRG